MSDFYNKYPYTDFHELNLDWVIERVKKLTEDWAATLEEWNSTEEQWQELYNYVHDYFDNLNVQTEINNKIDAMILDGTFQQIATPIIQAKVAADLPGVVSDQIGSTVAGQIGTVVASQIDASVAGQISTPAAAAAEAWLAAHITQPTTPAIDNTLMISGAGADAQKTGLLAAVPYNANNTYHIGDYVNYNGTLYQCIYEITTAEAWDSDHWGSRKLSNEIRNIQEIQSLDNNSLYISKTNIGTIYVPMQISAGDVFNVSVTNTGISISTCAYYAASSTIDDFPSLSANTSEQVTATQSASFFKLYMNSNNASVRITKVGSYENDVLIHTQNIDDLYNKTADLKNTKATIKIAYGDNMFDYNNRIPNKDVNSGTGALVDSATYYASEKIYIDASQPLTITGAYGSWAYCYDDTDHYYGRINCDSGYVISDTYPYTTYIRISALNAVTEVMIAYGYNVSYKPFNPISGYIVPASDIVLKNYGDYRNYYNVNTIILNKDINSGTGAIVDSAVYFVSDKIYMDFTEGVIIGNSYNNWAYCYKNDNTYLGRIQCNDETIIANTYADTGYIRITGVLTDTNVVVTYGNMPIPYNASEIDGYLHKDPIKLRICQYNTGDFSGINMSAGSDEIKAAMIELMSDVNADIYGLEYDTQYFGANAPIYDSILAFKKYYYSEYTGPYNGKAFLSDYQISNVKRIAYHDIGSLSHAWFLAGDIRIGGRNIKLITLHVDWQDNDRRYAQLQQVKAYADDYPYCIIIGDFNPDDCINGVKQSDNMTTAHDLAIFKADDDFASANAGYWGSYKTEVHPDYEGIIWDGDNILVTTANIEINNSRVVYRDWMNDHAVLYADITIY